MGLSRPLLIFSERRLGGLILGDALYSRLLLLLCGIEGSEKLLDLTPSLDPKELLLCFDDRNTDPANDHPSALPTLHVPRARHDPAVQVLDGIGRCCVSGHSGPRPLQ